MTQVDYGNGTAVVREYDAADRPTLIRYEDAAGSAYLALAYQYTADGLVSRITETDEFSPADAIVIPGQPIGPIVSQVDFEYDNRNRLTRETRMVISGSVDVDLGPAEYDLSYAYDAGGNRLTKMNNRSGELTMYHYDVHVGPPEDPNGPDDNGQHNNRLLWYDVTGPVLQVSTGPMLEQTIYTYGPAGNVLRLVKRADTTGDGVID